MNAVPVGREAELERIGLFLDVLGEGPAALVLVGEPGIGKTTLWREGLGEATRRGYRVLASRPVESEARLSYAALADLLPGVEDWLLDELPAPQRSSLEVALLREGPGGAAPDPRAIATASSPSLNGFRYRDRSWSCSTTRSGSIDPPRRQSSSLLGD